MTTTGTADTELPPGVGSTDRVVLFDGVCNLCTAWSQFLIRHDPAATFKLAPMQSPAGQAVLRWAGMDTDEYLTMVVVEGRRIYTRSSAFFRVMRGLGLPWSLLVIFALVPRVLRDWVYDRIAKNRYTLFGRRDSCLLPSPETARHFLEGAET
jgi:predicted DCC family thiol-disulfide oxidoreductase YuxK